MSNSTQKKAIVAIDDKLINQAILAIESTEPSPKEREDMLLARLIPAIMQALRRGDTKAKVWERLKAEGIRIHYTRRDKLFEEAESLLAERGEPLSGGAV